MKVNAATIELIKSFESLRTRAYQDTGGVWTIGYGHTSAAGNPKVFRGMVVSPESAERILMDDVTQFAMGVEQLVIVNLNDNQFGALVSFAFNVGLGAFKGSSVLARVNNRQFAEVPARLNLWVKDNGKVLKGLVRRRKAEGALFMTPGA